MRNKYSIGIIMLTVLFIYIISYEAYNEYKKTADGTGNLSIQTDGQAFDEQGFYLFEVNDYIVVFENDRLTPYEYTDILYEDLPDLLKQEIRNGKYIKNEEELYGFLENYTS